MLNQYPHWKHVLLAFVFATGCFFALPNLFGEDPAIQISASRGAAVDQALLDRVTQRLEASQIAISEDPELGPARLLLRFENEEDQLKAKDAVAKELGLQYGGRAESGAGDSPVVEEFGSKTNVSRARSSWWYPLSHGGGYGSGGSAGGGA